MTAIRTALGLPFLALGVLCLGLWHIISGECYP